MIKSDGHNMLFPIYQVQMLPRKYLITLGSGINVALRSLFFGIFSRGYGHITDLKDLNFTT